MVVRSSATNEVFILAAWGLNPAVFGSIPVDALRGRSRCVMKGIAFFLL